MAVFYSTQFVNHALPFFSVALPPLQRFFLIALSFFCSVGYIQSPSSMKLIMGCRQPDAAYAALPSESSQSESNDMPFFSNVVINFDIHPQTLASYNELVGIWDALRATSFLVFGACTSKMVWALFSLFPCHLHTNISVQALLSPRIINTAY
jgi:hypothetical protein